MRQDPHNRPEPVMMVDDSNTEETIIVNDHEKVFTDLFNAYVSVESYLEIVSTSGNDGLSENSKQFMAVGLEHIDRILGKQESISLEAILKDPVISQEALADKLKEIGKKILELIQKLIEEAKQLASRILSGVSGTEKKTEELLKLVRQHPSTPKPSNELHNEALTVSIGGASKMFAGKEWCLDKFDAEKTVIRFFVQTYPRYLIESITKVGRALKKYDVHDGDTLEFDAASEFIGKHLGVVAQVKEVLMPGNFKIMFNDGSLSPYVLHDEDINSPSTYELEVRSRGEIEHTLKENLKLIHGLAELFREEAKILDQMKTLSQDLLSIEDRRSEAIWKSSKEAVDRLSNTTMDIIKKLRPNYGPIVARINAIANVRNKICELELTTSK